MHEWPAPMKYKKYSRKQKLGIDARRASWRALVVLIVALSGGALLWVLTGRPRRHGNHWHWENDQSPKVLDNGRGDRRVTHK